MKSNETVDKKVYFSGILYLIRKDFTDIKTAGTYVPAVLILVCNRKRVIIDSVYIGMACV